jgi:predicted lysophospholipase L1 biosynthesis ABC-type transport system permease subunit
MRRDLAGEVVADVLAEWDILVVAEVGIRLGVALGVLADFRVVVVLAEVLDEQLGGRWGEA